MDMRETVAWRVKTARGVLRGARDSVARMDHALADDEAWSGVPPLQKGDLRSAKARLDCALADMDAVIEELEAR